MILAAADDMFLGHLAVLADRTAEYSSTNVSAVAIPDLYVLHGKHERQALRPNLIPSRVSSTPWVKPSQDHHDEVSSVAGLRTGELSVLLTSPAGATTD